MTDPIGYHIPTAPDSVSGLFDSALALTSRLDLTEALQEFVETAWIIVGVGCEANKPSSDRLLRNTQSDTDTYGCKHIGNIVPRRAVQGDWEIVDTY